MSETEDAYQLAVGSSVEWVTKGLTYATEAEAQRRLDEIKEALKP